MLTTYNEGNELFPHCVTLTSTGERFFFGCTETLNAFLTRLHSFDLKG